MEKPEKTHKVTLRKFWTTDWRMAGETDGGDVMGALCFARLQSYKSRKKKIHTNQGQIASISVLRMIDIPKFFVLGITSRFCF